MCYDALATREAGAVHIARVVRKYQTKDGESRESVSHLLRRSYRQDGKIRHETLGNVSALPESALEALRASLAGKTLVVAGEGMQILRSLPHGHLAAVSTMAKSLGGLKELLGPECKERDIAYALILSRVVHPRPKLATTKWWADTTLLDDLGLVNVGTDEVYAAMDWLGERQGSIEAALARRHLGKGINPQGLALFDLSSSWVHGSHNELAARGCSRNKKRGLAQIEYGLLTDPEGRPVAIEVFEGNTADPAAFVSVAETIRTRFGLDRLTVVGDRGMITSARITALRDSADLPACGTPRSQRLPKRTGPCGSPSLTRPTWRSSHTPTIPTNAWWPAATRYWPPSDKESAPSCSRPPKPHLPPSSPPWPKAASRGRTRSGCGWAR